MPDEQDNTAILLPSFSGIHWITIALIGITGMATGGIPGLFGGLFGGLVVVWILLVFWNILHSV